MIVFHFYEDEKEISYSFMGNEKTQEVIDQATYLRRKGIKFQAFEVTVTRLPFYDVTLREVTYSI